jgi:hypothetical protein
MNDPVLTLVIYAVLAGVLTVTIFGVASIPGGSTVEVWLRAAASCVLSFMFILFATVIYFSRET